MNVKVIGINYNHLKKPYLLSPELLASVLARYSRSNKGIDEILSLIDFKNPDSSVDRIFKFIDYGHNSIAGLTSGIPIVIDNCSAFMAYKIFEIAQLCDGQESSTRYIKMDISSISDPKELGLPQEICDDWYDLMKLCFYCYNKVYDKLQKNISDNPNLITIPEGTSDKVKDRLYKNYALDRARYFIPFALKTNAAYIMTARVWMETIKQLDSLPYTEARICAQKIRNELQNVVPRLIKHSEPDSSTITQFKNFITYSINKTKEAIENKNFFKKGNNECFVNIDNAFPNFLNNIQTIENAFEGKINKYSLLGNTIKRIFVRVAWNNIPIAELRDLNRHRSGYRFSTLVPTGFYYPEESSISEINSLLNKLHNVVSKILSSNAPWSYIYALPLGTEVPFEHSTHLDKLIYEIELRTSIGAHFKYAELLKEAHKKLINILPNINNFIKVDTLE